MEGRTTTSKDQSFSRIFPAQVCNEAYLKARALLVCTQKRKAPEVGLVDSLPFHMGILHLQFPYSFREEVELIIILVFT